MVVTKDEICNWKWKWQEMLFQEITFQWELKWQAIMKKRVSKVTYSVKDWLHWPSKAKEHE